MLNPTLYDRLKKAFGVVKIANEGRPFKGQLFRDALSGTGDYKIKVIDKGECYCVCCPFCGDTRFRLWFGHRWGTKLRGVPIKYAAICFNEECQRTEQFYSTIRGLLAGYTGYSVHIKEVNETKEAAPMSLPGDCIPISELPDDHYGIQYVRGRGYDPHDLAVNWGIVWRNSGSALSDYYRLIIPIYVTINNNTYLAGWQARYLNSYTGSSVPHDKSIPKYMTSPGLRKSQILYNGWRMGNSSLVVVCEGPLDAIRVGQSGVAVLGSDASAQQENILVDNYKKSKSPIVVMLDNDMDEKAENLTKRLRSRGCIALRVHAPGGKDPGDCTREDLYRAIVDGLSSVGG